MPKFPTLEEARRIAETARKAKIPFKIVSEYGRERSTLSSKAIKRMRDNLHDVEDIRIGE